MKNYKKGLAVLLTLCFVIFGVLGAFSAEEATTQTTPQASTQTATAPAETISPDEAAPAQESRWSRLLQFIVNAIILGIVGILLLIIGYYIWELVTVNYSVREQLVDHKNSAVAIVTASFVLGMAIVIGIALTKI